MEELHLGPLGIPSLKNPDTLSTFLFVLSAAHPDPRWKMLHLLPTVTPAHGKKKTQEDGQGSRPEKDNKLGHVPLLLTHPLKLLRKGSLLTAASLVSRSPPIALPDPRTFVQAAFSV